MTSFPNLCKDLTIIILTLLHIYYLFIREK